MEDIFRKEYKALSADQIQKIQNIKIRAENLLYEITSIGGDVSIISVSITRLEECVMWAVKAVTA